MTSTSESYILFDKNTPVILNGGFGIDKNVINAYGCWAGLVADMVASGSAPFIRIKLDGARIEYHFTVFALAPFSVVMDENKIGLMALDYSVLAFGRLLSRWMYSWPWAGCSVLESPNSENQITKLILVSTTPKTDIIVDVPNTLIHGMKLKALELAAKPKNNELNFIGD